MHRRTNTYMVLGAEGAGKEQRRGRKPRNGKGRNKKGEKEQEGGSEGGREDWNE